MGTLEGTPKPRLDGKVAIITGGASGIGEATVRLFVENGAIVIIADIQDELGHKVVASIGTDKSSYKHCDVRDEKQVEELVGHAVEKYGRLDVVCSNAGIMGPSTSILEMDLSKLDSIMAVNFRGMAAMIKHAARVMVATKTRGSIICTSSITSFLGGLGPHDYTASKHAVNGIVRSAASELGKHGIRVNCVCPHLVATPLSCGTHMDPSMIENLLCETSNLKGFVFRPEHVAQSAVYLASDESAFVSGHNLILDGGFSVVNHAYKLYN